MRHRVLPAAGGIDWSAPTTLDVSPYSAGDYTLAFSSATPGLEAVGQSIAESTAPTAGVPAMRHQGRVNQNNSGEGTLVAQATFEGTDILIAPGRTYRISGELELDPASQGTFWDAQSWIVLLSSYTAPNQGGSLTFAWSSTQPQTPDNSNIVPVSIDETFTMPAGAKSLSMGFAFVSKWANVVPGPRMYFWDWQLELV